MKNLFTYKNNIASGLKRYGKFLLLAISLLFVSNTAWAAAPAGLYMKCNTTTDVEDYSSTDYKWENMHKVEAGKWEITVTLENQKNNFFVGTNKTASGLFTKNVSFEAKDNSSCVTTVDKEKDYGGKRRIYIGKDDNASCEVTFIITYISDTQYKLEIVDVNPVVLCEDKEPTVTTGTMTVDAYNFFVVNDNNLIDLGTNCDVAIAYQSKGVEITTNKEGSKDRYTTVTSGATGNTLGVYTITATGVQPQNNTTYWYRAYAINNTSAGIGNDGVGYGEWKSFNLSIPGTPPSIRIGKQPVVSNLTEVTMNFQMADWGCTKVTKVKVYYTVTDIKTPNAVAPTTESAYWEFDTEIEENINFDLVETKLPSGNYNIKAVAYNSKGWGEELSDMASFTIQACEKPAQPTITNASRTACGAITLSYGIAVDNDVLVIVNEGTESTAVAPQDGQAYTDDVAPEGITITKNTNGTGSTVIINGLDGHKQYTVTCYQYVKGTYCYSTPYTYIIEKGAPEIEVAVTNITLSTAIANIKVKNTLGVLDNLTLIWYLDGVAQSNSRNLKDAPDSDGNISYTITNLSEDKTYQLEVYALNNYGCQTTTERVEFTTATCPKLTQYNVTGVNTIGKVQATITMASSQTDAIYQLFIGDTPIDGSVQEGTGEALTWQVNQTGLYYVKGWFKEAPDYCANGATIMDRYDLDCVQAPTPVIRIDKNTICSNDNATISVTAVEGVTYQLYKDGDLVSDKNITNDGEFTGITEAGSYTVVATTKDKCQATATSQIVTLTVIDASASVTINPTTDTTTPWVPVNFTVTSTAGAPYTLVYKDAAGKNVTNQMVVVKKGNSYSLKIPRPSTWAKGNSTDPVATTTYTVEASLEGQASCGSTSTLTITLNDTFEICE